MKYLIVIEKTNTGFSAYSPDVDGCIATGKNEAAVRKNMQSALAFHLQGLQLQKQRAPRASPRADYLEVAVA